MRPVIGLILFLTIAVAITAVVVLIALAVPTHPTICHSPLQSVQCFR